MPDFKKQSIANAKNHKSAETQTIAHANFKKQTLYSDVYFCITLLIFVLNEQEKFGLISGILICENSLSHNFFNITKCYTQL